MSTAELYERYVMQTYSQSKTLVKGKGTRVWDDEGMVYLDFIAGISVLNVGHSHPKVVSAVQDQAEKLFHVSNLYYNEVQGILAEKLSEVSLKGKCFFCNSGAEANEALIKLARLNGSEKGRYEIICMQDSFHGRTLATAAATGQDKVKKGFEPMPDGFVHAEFNNLDSVKALISDKTAAILLEAVQGEGGILPATEEFMTGVRELCDENGIMMLCDEVQCGLGRTGHWFGFQEYGVEPDAFSSAKSLGSGYPIGAICAKPEYSDVFKPGHHASTFGGTPLACAAAVATLDAIAEEKMLANADRAGELLTEALTDYVNKFEHVKEIRGLGLMIGMVLDTEAKPLCDIMAEMGLLVLPAGPNVVRFLPPLNVKDSEIEEALDIVHDALCQMHGIDEDEATEPESEAPVETEPAADESEAEDETEPAADESEAPVEAEPTADKTEAAVETKSAADEAEAEDEETPDEA